MVAYLAVVHLVKANGRPSCLINVPSCVHRINALTDATAGNLLVYKGDPGKERGRTTLGSIKGDLGCSALISASEESVSMWSLLRQLPGKRSAESGFRVFYTG